MNSSATVGFLCHISGIAKIEECLESIKFDVIFISLVHSPISVCKVSEKGFFLVILEGGVDGSDDRLT